MSTPLPETETETAQCARCKKTFSKSALQKLWRFPLFILHQAHAAPSQEGDWLYCPACARSQNIGVVFLAVMLSITIAIGGGTAITYGIVGGWILGLFIWLSLYVRYRIQMAKFIRYINSLATDERKCVIAGLSKKDRERLFRFLNH